MKIRKAFVSNSSSSSFIVAYDPADFTKEHKCPTCGTEIGGYNFFERLERADGGWSDSTKLHGTIEDHIHDLTADMKWDRECLAKASQLDPTALFVYDSGYTYGQTNAERAADAERDIAEAEEEIRMLRSKAAGRTTAYFSISYGDDTTSEEFNQLLKSGKIEMIKDLS
jgi:hypothetical protein